MRLLNTSSCENANVLKNTSGFTIAALSALKWRSMRNEDEVRRRVEILTFWQKYDTKTVKDAFKSYDMGGVVALNLLY